MKKYGYCISAGDYYLMSDVRAGQILFFDHQGRYVSTQSQKGLGPGEMLMPAILSYRHGNLLVSDIQRQGVHYFKLHEDRLAEAVFIKLNYTPTDIVLTELGAFVVGHLGGAGDSWALFVDLLKKEFPIHTVIKRDAVLGKQEGNDRRQVIRRAAVSANALCAETSDMFFTCWGGRMRIVGCNLKTKKQIVFGHPGQYFKEIKDSSDLEKKYNSSGNSRAERVRYFEELEKICAIECLVATKKSLYALFKTPFASKNGNKTHVLQRYSHDGVFLSETVLSFLFHKNEIGNQSFSIQAKDDKRDDVLMVLESVEFQDGTIKRFINDIAIK